MVQPVQAPSTAALTGSIGAFVAQLLGAVQPTAAGAEPVSSIGAVSVAISLDGDAHAQAAPMPYGSAGSGSGGAGATGAATSVGISGDGPASAYAASGTVGRGGTSTGSSSIDATPAISALTGTPTASSVAPVEAISGGAPALGALVSALTSQLLTANQAATTVDDATGCATGCTGPVDLDVAASPGCATGGDCAVALALAIGGTATATVADGPSPVPAASGCSGGAPGAARSIAISGQGPAQSTADRGAGADCTAGGTQSGTAQSGTAQGGTAQSGTTGNALALGMSADGPATSSATSGDSGATASGDGSGGAIGGAAGVAAASGDTGPAVGIAIARHGALAVVQSGSSGGAGAGCTGCGGAAVPGGQTAVAVAVSGATGASYSVAIAGLTASVTSASGDSGRSIAWTFQPAGAPAPVEAAPASADPVPVDVSPVPGVGNGRAVGVSGNTGDTVVIAVAPDTWVDVLANSGASGAVTSTVSTGPGCPYLVVQLSLACPPPPPVSVVGALAPTQADGTDAPTATPAATPTAITTATASQHVTVPAPAAGSAVSGPTGSPHTASVGSVEVGPTGRAQVRVRFGPTSSGHQSAPSDGTGRANALAVAAAHSSDPSPTPPAAEVVLARPADVQPAAAPAAQNVQPYSRASDATTWLLLMVLAAAAVAFAGLARLAVRYRTKPPRGG